MENLQGGIIALEHRYDVEAEVGQHALRTLYRGIQHPFGKSVWLSVYEVLEGADASLAERIKASAQTSSALEHDGVLRVADFGEIEEGVPFVVTERVSMPTLTSRLENEGPLSLEETLSLCGRLADVLERAHDRKVVHGSLGPHCVFAPARSPERARVGFFGLGFTMSEIRKLEGVVADYESVAPLAPELFGGGAPTVASDVYALGVLVYECLTGQHPYFEEREDLSKGLMAIQKAESKIRPLTDFGIERRVWAVVEKALKYSPGARWTSVSEFADELTRSADTGSKKAQKPVKVAVDEPVIDEAPAEEAEVPAESGRKEPGIVLGVLALLLVVSNVGWFLAMGQQAGKDVSGDVPAVVVEPSILKQGVEIATQPGAKVFTKRDGQSVELGETPLALDPSIGADGVLDIELQSRGFLPQTLRVEESNTSLRVSIPLRPQ